LTPRELEIADLVALGLTNPQIAERLVISPGTVRIHVERILGKLGRTSRVQIATWVVDERNSSQAMPATHS
jgi:non-specific serine/threonine protein kinase